MSLHRFLDALSQSPATQRAFFNNSRQAMLRALSRKYRYVPHQMMEDAAMQAFEQLWNDEVGQFQSPHPENSSEFQQDITRYLALVIAPRRLMDLWRRNTREMPVSDLSRLNDDELSDDVLFDRLLPVQENDTVASNAEHNQLLQRLKRCVEHLSPKLRAVVSGVLNDVKQVDTANALGIPEGTVKSRMSEATRRLKRCMGIETERA